MSTVERNDPCPCGSGKKYKHCCLRKQTAPMRRPNPEEAFIPMRVQIAMDHFANGRLSQAASVFQQILLTKPNHAEALHRMGLIAYQQGDSAKAVALLGQAVEAKPSEPSFYVNLGNVLFALERTHEALQCYTKALQINPHSAKAHSNMGAALRSKGLFHDSVASYERALVIEPDNATAHNNMANVLRDMWRLEAACVSCQNALRINPGMAEAHNNLGNLLQLQGKLSDAIDSYRRALHLKPDYFDAHSNLLMAMHYSMAYPATEIYEEHRRYSERVHASVPTKRSLHVNDREPGRRLKIGYVSGDFRAHPVGFFVEPLLKNQDKSQVEIYCYNNSPKNDYFTKRLSAHADHWLDCKSITDEQLFGQISADNIDILVDLSGHTAHNRLPVFARKPAPVQVSWLGYCATTGLPEVDYYVADAMALLPSQEEQFVEVVCRLPKCYLCFSQPAEDIPILALGATTPGKVTFGSFNNITKMSDETVRLWSRILKALPESQLFLKSKQLKDEGVVKSTLARYADYGIDASRLILEGHLDEREEHLAAYNRVDIALDSYPYNGVTTTVEALWMGVPVLTLSGARFLSRQGVTLLTNVGLAEWIALDADDYVTRAISGASDLPRLEALRSVLRQQMLESPIFDEGGFTANFTTALREMWQSYVADNRSAEQTAPRP